MAEHGSAALDGPDAWEPHRRLAEDALDSADWAAADREYAELQRAAALTPGDARRWVATLSHIGAAQHDTATLRDLAESFPEEDDVVEYVADELWRRAEELSESAGPTVDLTMAQLAWSAALQLSPTLARSDEDAIRMIGLLDRLYQASRSRAEPFGSFDDFERALLAFAAAGPQATLRAADLLAAEDPGVALELVAGREESADAVLVAAVASSELEDFPRAASLFDHLAIRFGVTARGMDVEDRSRWIQAMTDVGRLEEAEQACRATLAALGDDVVGTDGAWPVPGVTQASRDHWLHSYRLLAYRLATQRGRFREAWDLLRAAADVRLDGQPTALRRSVLRVRLTFVDRAGAAAILEELAALAVVDPCDTTYAEACLWAWTRWGAVRRPGEDNPLAGARFRGQAAARSILARADCPMGSRQRLRVVLLAGDDDRAARLLELEPLQETEPWTVQVLGAILAMRRGDDAAAHEILGAVLPQRRHDVQLRVLSAQADLIRGDYKEALKQAMALTDGVPEHILARTIRAESEFESALADAAREDEKDSVENVQQLISAARHYRRVADLHRDTTDYILRGSARPGAVIGSEPLAPRLYGEVCRRGMHAAILAQEGLARLGLRSDRGLVMDARDLTHHLRSIDRSCCRRADGSRPRRLLHQIRHLPDRDEAARLALLMISYQKSRWQRRVQNAAFLLLGAVVAWLALTDQLPGPTSDSIRVMMLGVGVLLLLMPFARSLKVGVGELSRDAPIAPLSGRSKSMRTSRLLLRTHHLGMFTLPTPPDKGRRAHHAVRDPAPASIA